MTQTIETHYKNLNNLASLLRQAGAVINVTKTTDDIFTINVKRPPLKITIAEIVTLEGDTSVKEIDSIKATEQSKPKANKQPKSKANKQSKPKVEDFGIETDDIPF